MIGLAVMSAAVSTTAAIGSPNGVASCVGNAVLATKADSA